MLKPIPEDGARPVIHPPARTCEACGKVVPVGHDAINVIIVVGSPGHPELPPFQCPHEEHWACSIDCWLKVAHACIDEHISQVLSFMRSSKGL